MRSIDFQPLRLISETDRVTATSPAQPAPAVTDGKDVEVAWTLLAGSKMPPIDHERVVELRNAILDGTYAIEPDRIAAAMIAVVHAPRNS